MPQPDRIPLKEKVAYAVGEFPNGLPGYMPTQLASQIFNMSMGIAPSWVTGALAVFRLIDAFTDPLVGWWSDRFRSRFGRRRPFMFVGLLGMAATLPFFFAFSRDWPHAGVMAWFVALGTTLFFFNTLWNIPYQSMLLEMTPDYHERTGITAIRSVVSKLQVFALAWMWWFTQLPVFADPVTGQPDTLRGAQGLSLVIAGVILLFGFFPVFLCKERYYATATRARKEPFWRSMRLTLACKPFRVILGLIILLQIPNLVNGLGAYVSTYYVFGGSQKDAAFIGGWGGTLSHAIAIAAVPLVWKLARSLGKERVLQGIVLMNIPVALAMPFVYNPAAPWLMLIKFILTAPLVTGLWMLVPSMQADIVDYDELETGERREGSFAAVFSWTLKLASTLMFGLSGPVLDLIGFEAKRGGQQMPGVFAWMIGLMMVVPVVSCIGGLWLLRSYPISPAAAADIRTRLEARRGTVGSP